jgi:hypothetical protein
MLAIVLVLLAYVVTVLCTDSSHTNLVYRSF